MEWGWRSGGGALVVVNVVVRAGHHFVCLMCIFVALLLSAVFQLLIFISRLHRDADDEQQSSSARYLGYHLSEVRSVDLHHGCEL